MAYDYNDALIKTEYNLNDIKSRLIGNQQIIATHHYSHRRYVDSFMCWKSIRLLITNRLEKKEVTRCKQWELLMLRAGGRVEDGRFIRNGKFVLLLDGYVELIGDYLRKIGLDIEDKEDEGLF